jgi:1,4-dihydroxy-2-naphthoate octaprenyltransferase
MYKIKYWVLAARPKTLIATFIPILPVSTLCLKNNTFSLPVFIFTLLSAIFIQIMTNFINDLYDFKKGADRSDRIGPDRVIQKGYLNEKEITIGIYVLLFLSVLLGGFLVSIGGFFILIIGLSSFLFAYLYTATKFSIAYNGLGEMFVFLYFGVLASLGTYYLQTLSYSSIIIVIGIIAGSLNSSMLIINNIRDYKADQLSNKKTLIVIFGRTFGKLELLSINLLSYFSLYYLLASLNKVNFLYIFSPILLMIILIMRRVFIDDVFINQKALSYYSLYITIYTIFLSFIILL